MNTKLMGWIAACALAVGCGGGGAGGGGGTRTCETPGGRLEVGPYIVANDSYMNSELPPERRATNYTMCASAEAGSDGAVNAAWAWNWPEQESFTLRATPSVIFGHNPWDAESTTSALPAPVGDVGALTVDAQVEQTVDDFAYWQLGTVVWLTTSNQRPSGSYQLPLAGSVQIYRNSYALYPSTPTVSGISIGGMDWNLHVNGTAFVYYAADGLEEPATTLHLDVGAFLADLQARGLVQATWWVASVNTAAFLFEGTGELALTDYEVQFARASERRRLTVTKSGLGTGTVASTPAGIECGATCSATYATGTVVTLTANAGSGAVFAGWSGACSGTDACVVTMDAARAVQAAFDQESQSGESETCETPGGRLYLDPYIVTNDTYMNSGAGAVGNYTMCAAASPGTDGAVNASWTWSWPVGGDVRVRATPSVIFGFNPWDAGSTTAELPALVPDVGSLTVNAGVAQTVGQDQISDFGVVVYLTTSNQKTGSDPLPIGKRVLIYRNRYGMSAGTPTASAIPIDGVSWDYFSTSSYVMYLPHADRDVPATALDLDLAHFLADALDRGGIQASWWVASVNTAAILYQGTGSLELTDYEVQFTPAN